MKVKELINYGREVLIENNIEDYSIISKMLAKHILNMTNVEIIINEEKEISEEEKNRYDFALTEIVKGIPVQYITYNQEFMGMNFYVNEDVLIPQPDTEILVEEVIKLCKNYKDNIKILDICTGSGAIGISIVKSVENINLIASDISDKALEIAKKNAKNNEILNRIDFVKSDMFENINDKFDIIVSNPPYIETNVISTLSKQVQNEPHLALDGGKDGLDFYRILANQAKEYLKPNGYLCMEIGYNQKDKVEQLLKENGYKNIYCKKDLSGNDRVIIANNI